MMKAANMPRLEKEANELVSLLLIDITIWLIKTLNGG